MKRHKPIQKVIKTITGKYIQKNKVTNQKMLLLNQIPVFEGNYILGLKFVKQMK